MGKRRCVPGNYSLWLNGHEIQYISRRNLCARQNNKWSIDRWRTRSFSRTFQARRLVQPANFPNRLSIGRGCHLAGTLSEPGQRAPLFHKQKTAALRVMAVFFERPSANRRPPLAGANYKRNWPTMIEIFYVNRPPGRWFLCAISVCALHAIQNRYGKTPRQIGNV